MLALLLGYGLDRWLGEARRWHPVVGLGNLAQLLEGWLHPEAPSMERSAMALRLRGMLALLLLLAVSLGLTASVLWLGGMFGPAGDVIAGALVLYVCLGHRSLAEHAQAVADPLRRGDLDEARAKLRYIVSRDTKDLRETDIAKGVVESVLENGSDAVVGSLVSFALLGPLGAVAHRVINTMDAMWGYRSSRYRDFGWASARLDDVVNWLPARICAWLYALLGDTREALACWMVQARRHDSPNAGPVMASGAGALGLELGGDTMYQGQVRKRPRLGRGQAPTRQDIPRALALVRRCVWIVLALCSSWIAWRW